MRYLRTCIAIIFAATIITSQGCAVELTPEQKQMVLELRQELNGIRQEIAKAIEEDAMYRAGLIKNLIAVRLEVLKTNEALIEQRINALEAGSRIKFVVNATDVDIDKATELAKEIGIQQNKLAESRKNADRYSGGLVKAMAESEVATIRNTLAMLEQQYIIAKYGLAIPAISSESTTATPKIVADTEPISKPIIKEQAQSNEQPIPKRDGPFGLEMGMSLDEIGGMPEEISNGKYKLGNIPNPHPAFEFYAVQVCPKNGLCWIKAIGNDIRTSVYGLELKSAFSEMKEKLERVYGKSKTTDLLMPDSIWNEPKDYMIGLIKQERHLMAIWEGTESSPLKYNLVKVGLIASAKSQNIGYISIEYYFTNYDLCEKELSQQSDEAL